MKKISIILSIIICHFIAGCGQVANVEDVIPTSVVKNPSSEAVFRGIFFLQGNTAENINSYKPHIDKLNNLKKTNPLGYKKYLEFTNKIVEKIQTIDSNFLTNFENKIRSKNYYEVEEALHEGADMIRRAALNTKEYAPLFVKEDEVIREASIVSDSKEKNSKSFGDKVGKKYFNKSGDNGPRVNMYQDEDACLVPGVAVAVAVWEVAGLVNVVTIVNYINTVFAIMIAKAKTVTRYNEEGSRTNTQQEMLISEISASL